MSKDDKPKATFEVFKDHSGKFRWRLRASNGEVIAASQAYESKESTMNGIEEYRVIQHATAIAESATGAAQEAKADSAWISKWTQNELRPMLRDAYVEANEIIKEKEDTWPNRFKKGALYVVGIIVTIIVTAIVAYYLALAGFKV